LRDSRVTVKQTIKKLFNGTLLKRIVPTRNRQPCMRANTGFTTRIDLQGQSK